MILGLAVACLAASVVPASAGSLAAGRPAGPKPVVEGPVPGTPVGAAPYDVSGAGYVEQEFFLSGTAKTYTTPARTAPFKVRMLVYRPTSAKAFNGSAIAEWENVTAQVPGGHPMFAWLDSYALTNGYAFVQIAAQATPAPAGSAGHGELGHVVMDPARYRSLAHPGDDFSYDIFTQAMRSLTSRRGSDPMGGLNVKQVIATGNSQSASRLHTYVETVQREARVADALLLDAGGSKTFANELPLPTIQLLSEDGFSADAPNRTSNYRLWEVAGASHNDADFNRNLNAVAVPGATKRSWAEQQELFRNRHYGEQGLTEHATCVVGVGGNEFPRRYAVAAAVEGLRQWVRSGRPAPSAPRVQYDGSGAPVKDEHGNVVGGLRLPPLDVPVATYYGDTCTLFGMNVPLAPTVISELYPTHDSYVAQLRTATRAALARGWMVPQDAAELMRLAQRSAVGTSPL
jgi:hypothetical protein